MCFPDQLVLSVLVAHSISPGTWSPAAKSENFTASQTNTYHTRFRYIRSASENIYDSPYGARYRQLEMEASGPSKV